jgi:hypothetical protein
MKTVTFSTTCPICRKGHSVTCNEKGYNSWKSGKAIQLALPELDADSREALKTGICKGCWNDSFGGEDD